MGEKILLGHYLDQSVSLDRNCNIFEKHQAIDKVSMVKMNFELAEEIIHDH